MSKPTSNAKVKGITQPVFAGDIPAVSSLKDGPFVFEHYVAWGDCDPAQIAYTANIPGWGLLAIEDWYRKLLGHDWYSLNIELGIGTPFVSLKFDFVAPVKPPTPLEIEVTVEKLGNSSITHCAKGYQQGILCFEGVTVAVFVNATTMKPIAIPPNIKECIEHFISG